MTVGLIHYLIVAAILFVLGLIAIISRRNAVGVLIGVELVLNAANLNFVAFSRYAERGIEGQIFVIFIILLAACEVAVALAIVINLFANLGAIDVDRAGRMKR
ncbi:NADH-quinone oxidoreductase subunit NuoK [Candidatus Sumerlaeota bacterium]|nr:NADH-quinone oxidoreductase subunit NuoK [Candidatus Sumerlaeota bacterium]